MLAGEVILATKLALIRAHRVSPFLLDVLGGADCLFQRFIHLLIGGSWAWAFAKGFLLHRNRRFFYCWLMFFISPGRLRWHSLIELQRAHVAHFATEKIHVVRDFVFATQITPLTFLNPSTTLAISTSRDLRLAIAQTDSRRRRRVQIY